jgi:hypothetical protein
MTPDLWRVDFWQVGRTGSTRFEETFTMWTQKWFSVVLVAVVFVVFSPFANGADTKKDKAADKSKSTKDKATKAKPRGRLPAYYRQVVDDAQRDKIYAIQAKYRTDRDQIGAEIKRITSDLRKKLIALKQAQNEEVESVLTDTQKSKLDKIRTAAAAERKQNKSSKSSTKNDSTSKKKSS